MSGRVERRRPYFRKNAEEPRSSLFELQPKSVKQQPYHTSKKHSKQNYLIVFKGLKHFVADVFQKNNSDLFVDNRCLITGDKKEQLRFPFIKWTVTKECLAVEKNCVFCSIAWLNRDLKARPVLPAVDRPGKMTVYPFERKSLDQRKASLAPLKVDMKNNTSRWPLAVEKIAVSQEFKKVISVKKFTKKTLLAGDQVEVEFLVNKDMLPYGAYGVPINVFYQNASEPEIQEIQIPLKLMIVSPAYNGNSRMKAKQILPTEEEVDEEEVVAKRIEGVKYMPYFDKPKAIETFAEREKRRLRGYPLPAPIRELQNAVKDLKGCDHPTIPSHLQTKLEKFEDVLSEPLTASNYAEKFAAVLHLEEFHEERDIAKYNLWNVPLRAGKAFMYRLTVGEGLAEGRPSLMTGDIVFVICNQEAEDNPSKSGSLLKSSLGRKKMKKGQFFYGTIKRVHLRDIVFECEDLSDVHKPYFKYNIQFSLNRFIYRLCYRALNLLNDNLLRILLPQGKYRKSYEKRELVFFNEDIAGNPEQVQAITNIVSRSCTPFPYIVFGPPGTGKTKTLVEAILQNWAVGKFQLVCASSNSAADVLVKEILKLASRNAYLNFEPAGNILRIYSASVEIGTVSETILNLQIHNFRATNEAKFPLMSVVLKTPIVVGTLATAARLSLEGVPANHFSHVYVDECGHCSEPECILAVSGIISGNSMRSSGEGLSGFWGEPPAPFETQLVLAGDPQQLGSTAHCNLSQMYNYGYSLLERLLNTTDMYQRDGRTGKYNGEVITKLSRNYRSHADIINISNQLFYHGELLESGKPEILNSCSEIDFLPQKNHPVIFHGVTGLEEQDNTSPSYYNLNEVDQVVTYISMLIEEANEKKLKFTLKDIGVVTPYKKQVQKLAQTFSDLKWEDVAVGSVDLFQGSEKLIIIISTVRASCTLKNSGGKSAPRQMDFVNDAKRFNVALTRAKALLIVIGDPEILQYQSYWKVYMDYCLDRGTYMGTIPAHYRQNNNLVKVTTPNHCSQKKPKAKKEKTTAKKEEVCMKTCGKEKKTKKNKENGGGGDYAEEKSLENLENSGGGDGCKVKSRKSVDVGKDDKKTFRDIIMDLDIEGYADANGTENKVSKKSVESLSNKTERNKTEEGENGGEEKGKRDEEDGSGQQGEDEKRENGGENISENDEYDIKENSDEGKEGEVAGESVLKKKRIRNRKQTNVMKVGDNKELMENPLQGDGKLCNNNSESFKNEYSDGTENENDASRNHPKVGEIEQTLASLAISD